MSDHEEQVIEQEKPSDLLPGEDLRFGEAPAPEVEEKPDDDAAPAAPEDSPQKEPEKGDAAEDAPKKETAKERRERMRAKYQREVEEANRKAEEAQRVAEQIRRAGESRTAPVEKDFASYDDFVAAKAVWAYARQERDQQASDAEQQAKSARDYAEAMKAQDRALLAQSWGEQCTEAKGKYADFEDVVFRPGMFPEGNHLADLIMGSDKAADLAYKVARDHGLHDRLVAMHPYEAARELGRLEATLTAPAPRVETKAPPPITPVAPKASATVDPAKMSYSDYVAARKAGRIK